MTYVAEYYYDKTKKCWIVNIIDEECNIVDFIYCKSLNKIKSEINLLKENYNIVRVYKICL